MRWKDLVLLQQRSSSGRTNCLAEWKNTCIFMTDLPHHLNDLSQNIDNSQSCSYLVKDSPSKKATLAEEVAFWQRYFYYLYACCRSFLQTGCKAGLSAGKVDPKKLYFGRSGSTSEELRNAEGPLVAPATWSPRAAPRPVMCRGAAVMTSGNIRDPIIYVSARERESLASPTHHLTQLLVLVTTSTTRQ